MLLFLVDLINIKKLRISLRFFYSLSFFILLFFVAELHQIPMNQCEEVFEGLKSKKTMKITKANLNPYTKKHGSLSSDHG